MTSCFDVTRDLILPNAHKVAGNRVIFHLLNYTEKVLLQTVSGWSY